jgi:hypothetical protein
MHIPILPNLEIPDTVVLFGNFGASDNPDSQWESYIFEEALRLHSEEAYENAFRWVETKVLPELPIPHQLRLMFIIGIYFALLE